MGTDLLVSTVLIAALLLGACGEDSEVDSTAVGSQSPAAEVPADGGVLPPVAFRDRVELPSCGTLDLGLMPDLDATELPAESECLRDAVGTAEGAELAHLATTIEGDVITEYVRALPGSEQIEIFTDSTEDKFGHQVWTRHECTGLTAHPLMIEYTECSDRETLTSVE